MVTTSQTESIKDVITRLLDKRALRYSNYDVLILATDEVCDVFYSINTSFEEQNLFNITNMQLNMMECDDVVMLNQKMHVGFFYS